MALVLYSPVHLATFPSTNKSPAKAHHSVALYSKASDCSPPFDKPPYNASNLTEVHFNSNFPPFIVYLRAQEEAAETVLSRLYGERDSVESYEPRGVSVQVGVKLQGLLPSGPEFRPARP